MKTIGQLLKDARDSKGYSLVKMENITKIKIDFIDAIENEKWDKLPPFPTVLGFVKNLSTVLDIDDKTAVAVLKRDYPPKKLTINPKPDVGNQFVWSPRMTFLIGVVAVVVIFFGYLIFQYVRFVSPPRLIVESPKQDQVITGNTVLVFGSTDGDAKITVNNQPVLLDENGKFSVNLDVVPETKEVDILAISRSGKVNEIKRTIKVGQGTNN